MQQLRTLPWMTLGLVGALSVVACGGEDNGNGNGTNDMGGNGGVDMGGNGDIDMGGNGDVDMGGNGDVDMGGNGDVDMGGNGGPSLTSITVNPNMRTGLMVGETFTFLARGRFSDNSQMILNPNDLDIMTSNPDVATAAPLNATEVQVTAVGGGDATITVGVGTVTAVVTVGVQAQSNCPAGEEGCPCTPSTDATSMQLMQDDCDSGLTCVPWDAFGRARPYGANGDQISTAELPQGSASSCVQQCTVDADCGTGRFCTAPLIIGAASTDLLTGVCVDEVAGPEEPCFMSKADIDVLNLDRTPDDGRNGWKVNQGDGVGDTLVPRLNTFQGNMRRLRGCADGMQCMVNLNTPDNETHENITGAQGYMHPDEGVCEPTCDPANGNADCNGATGTWAGRNVCGTVQFTDLGYCIDKVRGSGALCGLPPDSMDAITRVNTDCYEPGISATRWACVTLNEPQQRGVCLEFCDENNLCNSLANQAGSALTCTELPGLIPLCLNDCRTNDTLPAPDVCTEPGFTCRAIDFGSQTQPLIAEWCWEEFPPLFAPGEVTPSGGLVEGDQCNNSLACPDGHTCVGVPGATPASDQCLAFCNPDLADADTYCAGLIGTGSTCLDISANFTALSTALGFDVGACTTP